MAGNPYFDADTGNFMYPGGGLPPMQQVLRQKLGAQQSTPGAVFDMPVPGGAGGGPGGMPALPNYTGGAKTALMPWDGKGAQVTPAMWSGDPTYDYPGVDPTDPYGLGGHTPNPEDVFNADTGEFEPPQPEVFDLPDPGPEAVPQPEVFDLPDPEREPRPGSPYELDPMMAMFRPETGFGMRGGFGPTPVLPEREHGPQGMPLEAKLAALGLGQGGAVGDAPEAPGAPGMEAGASLAGGGDIPMGRFRIVGPNGQVMHRGDLSGLGNPDESAREKLGAAVEPLGDPKLVEIAKRLQGVVPDEQIPEYARKIWDAEQARSGRMDVAKLIEEGKNNRRGGGSGSGGAPGKGLSEDSVPKGWQSVNPAVAGVRKEVAQRFKLDEVTDVENSAKRALRSLQGKAMSQFSAIKDLVKAYDGSRPTDRDVQLVFDAAGKWEGLKAKINAWNPGPNGGEYPAEFKAQLAEIFSSALKAARKRREIAAAATENAVKELYIPILTEERKERLARAGRGLVEAAGGGGGAPAPAAGGDDDAEAETDEMLRDLGY